MGIQELRGETLSDSSAELSFFISGQSSASAARSLLLATAPGTHNGLPRRSREATVEEQESEDETGNIDYIGNVPYGTSGGSSTTDLEVGDTRILLSTLGGSVHITQSLSTVASYGDAEDHEGAIQVAGDGSVGGADILTGGLDFTILKIVASDDLSVSYMRDVLSLSTPNPHTNNATFSHTDTDGRSVSLSEGECIFRGMTNSPRGNGEDELRFEFRGSANLSDALPGSPWTIAKKGFEHLWLSYAQEEDMAAKKLITKAVSAYVEQLYEPGNFGLLSL